MVRRRIMDRVDGRCAGSLHRRESLMVPIADENPLRHRPWVTISLMIICTLVYFGVQPTGRNTFRVTDPRVQWEDLSFSLDWATVPCEITEGRSLSTGEFEATFPADDFTEPNGSACGIDEVSNTPASEPLNPKKPVYLGLLISMFLHGSVAHLAGNMLFLWVFGNNIEDTRGRVRYLVLYLVGGLLSDLAHILVDPRSTVPVVGASGAIAAVMGAYLVLYPKARIKTITPWFGLRKVAAGWVLGLWAISQFAIMQSDSNVAWAAHLGGFVVGAIWAVLWKVRDRTQRQGLPAPV
jgi:membrane associated rhomboid family serine protease